MTLISIIPFLQISKTSARANSCSKEGYFEYITAYIGVVFFGRTSTRMFFEVGRAVDLQQGRGEVD
jgi:hypothetical protein